MSQIKKWKEAHQHLDVSDEALTSMAPFPSLFATDFVAYLQSKEQTAEIVTYVRDILREVLWAYDNWAKAEQYSKASALLADLLNNAAHGSEYQFTHKFLRDYAKANNITLPHEAPAEPPWFNVEPPGQVLLSG